MNVWWNKKGGLEKKGWREGERGRRTKLRTTATTVVGEAWPLGLDMMGGFSFSFSFLRIGLDWIEIGLDWSGRSAVGGVAVTGVSLQLYVAQVARYLMVAEREKNPMIMIAVV